MGWIATLVMGLVLGLLGGGGGILTVPILVGFFGLSATAATGSSLFVVGLTSLVGAVQGVLKRQCELRSGAFMAVPAMIGAFASRAFLVPSLPAKILGWPKDDVLLGAFAVLMVIVGFRMLKPAPAAQEPKDQPVLVMVYGLLIGLLSGTLGAGGGFLILPVLTLLVGVEMQKAIPTSLMVISVQSLVGFVGELRKPIDWGLLVPIVGVALVGMVAGMLVRERLPRETLRLGFAFMVFAVAIWMFSKIL